MAARYLLLPALILGTIASELVEAAPTPVEPGWTVRLVASGFGPNSLANGVAYDPGSTDLFVTDVGNGDPSRSKVWRISQSGSVTPLYTRP